MTLLSTLTSFLTITHTEIVYGAFGIVLIVALLLDLGLMSKKGKEITIKQATVQTVFWIGLSLIFWAFVWYENGANAATKYISAYLMEWSLSIDNIFVFILIFAAFKVKETDMGRALLVGILLAIVFRILFIAVGIGLIDRFHWICFQCLISLGHFLDGHGYFCLCSKSAQAEADTATGLRFAQT